MDTSVFEKYESKVRSYCRKYPVVFKTAKDSYITDEDGTRYLDFFCGAGALDYGHNNEYIKQKVIDYIAGDGITHALDMYTTAKRDFLEYFEEEVIKPRGLDYVVQFPGPTGTNANEAALKLARKVTGRPNVFALMGAFHGMTLGTLACTSESYARGGAGIAMNGVTHIPAPYMFPELDTVEYMERLITDDHSGVELPAAIILETVQAEGGIYVLDEQYLRNVRDLCDRYGILLIADEVQVGCGRTGDFFSFQRAGIKPDMVSMSKSIGGYGMPFAVTLFRPELDIWGPGEHNGT
ncbi:MAG: diaminobutyrate--2-oxoglutarate transaminase, partial [Eubacteriales bacterium]|nr:diaminobutyrate--2-oxoglutarate transaminase [Eubacteriales bacterium]